MNYFHAAVLVLITSVAFTSPLHAAELSGPRSTPAAAPTELPSPLVPPASVSSGKPHDGLVIVPLTGESAQDTYRDDAQNELARLLKERGTAVTIAPPMDPVDARITAPDLCRGNTAAGVLVGSVTHRQQHKTGVVRGLFHTVGKIASIVPIAGAVAEAAINGVGNGVTSVAGSDDRYPSHAEVQLTLLDCNGKRIWGERTTGDQTHVSNVNVGSGETGALHVAMSHVVNDLVAFRSTSAVTPATPLVNSPPVTDGTPPGAAPPSATSPSPGTPAPR